MLLERNIFLWYCPYSRDGLRSIECIGRKERECVGLCVRWGVCIRLYAVEIKGQVTSIFSQSDYCVIKKCAIAPSNCVGGLLQRDNHDNNNIPTTTNNNIKIIEFVSCYCDMVLNISQWLLLLNFYTQLIHVNKYGACKC